MKSPPCVADRRQLDSKTKWSLCCLLTKATLEIKCNYDYIGRTVLGGVGQSSQRPKILQFFCNDLILGLFWYNLMLLKRNTEISTHCKNMIKIVA